MNLPWLIAGSGFGALSGWLIGGRAGLGIGAILGAGVALWVDEEEPSELAGDEKAGVIGVGSDSDQQMLATMEPVTRGLFAAFLTAAHAAGHRIYIRSARREYAEQKRLYDAYVARGRTGLPASNPDTNPSSHFLGASGDVGYLDDNGRPIKADLVPLSRWQALAKLGEGVGLKAGLYFSSPDKVHFERPDWRTLRSTT